MVKEQFGIPEIFEEQASGRIKEIYEDIKEVLKVPFVNFIFRTVALYEEFFDIAWNQVRENMLTVDMEAAAQHLKPNGIQVELPFVDWNYYYNPMMLRKIKGTIDLFNYVNPKLLIIASAWSESLANRPIDGNKTPSDYITPGINPYFPSINMVEMANAVPDIRHVFRDIMSTHHTMDIASDYRALAQFPHFLYTSWYSIKPYIPSHQYTMRVKEIKQNAIHFARQMPFPVRITPEQLDVIYSPREIAGIMGIVNMFQNILPILIVDGTLFNSMLSQNNFA